MSIKFLKNDTLAIKGVAILFLLHYHNFYPVDKFENYEINFYPFSMDTMVSLTKFLKICVAMFAFLSAYGLTLSLKKYNKDYCITGKQYSHYIKTRLPKLMWGYWFVFILSCALCAILQRDRFELYMKDGGLHGVMWGAFNVIADFLGLSSLMNSPTLCGTWWYMSLALFIVIIVPFAARMNKKYGFLAVTLLCVFIPRVLIVNKSFSVGRENSLLRWLFAVVLGVLFAQEDLLAKIKSAQIMRNKAVKFIISTLAVILSWIVYVALNGKAADMTYEIRDGVIPVIIIYYLYVFIIDIPVLRTVLMFLGKHSMNIFLFSTFIRGILFSDFIYSFKYWLLIDIALLLTSILSSIIIEAIKKYSRYNKLLDLVLQKIENNNSNSSKTAGEVMLNKKM